MLEGAVCVQGIEQKTATKKDFVICALNVTLEQMRKGKNCMIKAVTSEDEQSNFIVRKSLKSDV